MKTHHEKKPSEKTFHPKTKTQNLFFNQKHKIPCEKNKTLNEDRQNHFFFFKKKTNSWKQHQTSCNKNAKNSLHRSTKSLAKKTRNPLQEKKPLQKKMQNKETPCKKKKFAKKESQNHWLKKTEKKRFGKKEN